jgi:hypothetical protein
MPRPFRSQHYGFDNPGISAATAEVSLQALAYLLVGRSLILRKQRSRRQNHAWRTEAALERLYVKERLLYRVKMTVYRQAFDGRDALAGNSRGLHQAGPDFIAINQDRAGAARTFTTAVLGSRKVQEVAQEGQQRGFLRRRSIQGPTVHIECHLILLKS